MSRDELLRQKFLLDILRQVELPLQNPSLLQVNVEGVADANMYRGPIDDDMQMVLDLVRNNRLLGRNVMCSMTNEIHLRQLLGLYRLFVRARDFQALQNLAIYARRYVNPVLFVNALTLALQDRTDTEMLIVPAIYEILPRNYLGDEVVRAVEEIGRETPRVTENTNSVSQRPSLLDLIKMQRNAKLNFNPFFMGLGVGVGVGDGTGVVFDKSQLWMPWRDMHQQLAMQRTMGIGGRLMMPPDQNKDSVRIIPMGNSQGLLSDDLGLRAFLNILLDQLVVEQSNAVRVVDSEMDVQTSNRNNADDVRSMFMGRERNVIGGMGSGKQNYEDDDDDMLRRNRVRYNLDEIEMRRGGGYDVERNVNRPLNRIDLDARESLRENYPRMDQNIPTRRQYFDKDETILRNDRERVNQNQYYDNDDSILQNDRERVNQNLPNRRLDDEDRNVMNQERPQYFGGSPKLSLLNGKIGLKGLLNRNVDRSSDLNRMTGNSPGMQRNFVMERNVNMERGQGTNAMNRNLGGVDRDQGINRNYAMNEDQERNERRNYDLERDQDVNRNYGIRRNMEGERNIGIDRDQGIRRNFGINEDLQNNKKGNYGMGRDQVVNRNYGMDEDLQRNRNMGMNRQDDLVRVPLRSDVNRRNLGYDLEMDRKVNARTNVQGSLNRKNFGYDMDIDRDLEMGGTNNLLFMVMPDNVDRRNVGRDVDKRGSFGNLVNNRNEDDNRQTNRNLGMSKEVRGSTENIMNRRNSGDNFKSMEDDGSVRVSSGRLGLLNGKIRNTNQDDIPQRNVEDDMRRVPRSLNRITPRNERTQRLGELIFYNLQQLVARLNIEQIALQNSGTNANSMNRLNRVALTRNTMGNLDSSNSQEMINTIKEKMLQIKGAAMNANTIVDVMKGIGRLNQIDTSDMQSVQGQMGSFDNRENMDLTMLQNMGLDDSTFQVVVEKMQEITERLENTLEQNIEHLGQRQQHYNNYGLDDQPINQKINRLVLNEILQEVVYLSEYVEGGQISNILETPITQLLLRHIVNTIERQIQALRPTRNLNDIAFGDVTINNLKVDELRTYTEEVDVDLTNILNPIEVDSQKIIIGRMPRLNHKSFTINLDLSSNRNQRVVLRTLLIPKVDSQGRRISAEEQRQNVVLLDIFDVNLTPGRNVIKRKSRDITWTGRDVTTYQELYKRVMTALQGNIDLTLNPLMGQTTLLPHRLLLPRGRVEGLPMQLLVVITPADDDTPTSMMSGQIVNTRLGLDSLLLDNLPLTYPLDRNAGDVQKLLTLPNVMMRDILIYHEDKVNRLPQ
ncbi:fat-body protein 1-like [Musca vetustissima]|uniref:fat-body protein 1-like n=1 Tax=Musca vetustissima TaxID=27455 RepID=UPI002AB7E983|nr:fat-body protein 1-like [Musca vetustissima]